MDEYELLEKSSMLIRLHLALSMTYPTVSPEIVSWALTVATANSNRPAGPDYEQSHTPTALVTLQEF